MKHKLLIYDFEKGLIGLYLTPLNEFVDAEIAEWQGIRDKSQNKESRMVAQASMNALQLAREKLQLRIDLDAHDATGRKIPTRGT